MTYKPFEILGADRPSRWLVTCDHAANTVPDEIGGGCLGLPQVDMDRHIAYDVGAANVTRALADRLNARAILSNFSRLVIDPNRGEDDPTLLMKLYDGTIIPANRDACPQEVDRRLTAYHRPYHDALTDLAAARDDTVILSIHSFTPQLRGRARRPWQIGILYAEDTRLAHPLIERLTKEPDLCVGDNEPYSGHLPGDALDRHAVQTGRPHVLIELRNDLIAGTEGQLHWANRLAPILDDVLTASRF
ncbi:N-formylglutamate amidohydrolase [Pseudogemmobacter sp. W21_MBD1_M6]|uniref:N-formylglutamate amidohydrolase n=1 Tax=Pseudogemmobacter sp. W21_MBD1_M6 TaxID=3240271 RepID=UPI003F95B645